MSQIDERRGRARRVLESLGLANPPDGMPIAGRRKRSRYGVYVSGRLDEDLDALMQRVASLEEELHQRRHQ